MIHGGGMAEYARRRLCVYRFSTCSSGHSAFTHVFSWPIATCLKNSCPQWRRKRTKPNRRECPPSTRRGFVLKPSPSCFWCDKVVSVEHSNTTGEGFQVKNSVRFAIVAVVLLAPSAASPHFVLLEP